MDGVSSTKIQARERSRFVLSDDESVVVKTRVKDDISFDRVRTCIVERE